MKLVTRNDLERWADRVDSKFDLPYLISRLVRATTPSSTQADFPSGSAAYVGGWDGVVDCQEDTAYVPKGISLYEFGTEENSKGKADEDYNKRVKDSLGYTPKDCVFVFITPRFWRMKDKWIAAKKKEDIWKDIKVYDSSNLEQWLDNALATSRWFSSRIGSYPFDGVMTTDEFWEEWSIGPQNLTLLPEVVTAGRRYEQDQLLAILQGPPSIKAIKASTKDEAVAFIIAATKQFPINESERFISKSLIIDTEGNFRGIRINTSHPLNLIPRFEETQPLYAAVSKGHHVLVPLGADDNFNQETISLPTIDRDGQVNSLIGCGISREEAEKFSRESGRNITILKRLIGFPLRAKWISRENIHEIIPALLIGRWNENFEGDIELIEKLSGLKYSEYLPTLIKWKNFEESPILQIGETWRLTSPLDLWTNLSQNLTHLDFRKLHECFALAFREGNPLIVPSDKGNFSSIYNKKRRYSNWSREGLAQSLILVGRLGEGLGLPGLINPQLWVDNIISDLLYNASGELWISTDHELPLLSEASPSAFLKAVSTSLSKEHPEVMDMFKEVSGLLYPSSNHTGLLWALEGLAWLPEYLRESALILLKLAQIDPSGTLSNRPINSISEIFKPWHYQTLAPYDDRMEILKDITEKQRESGWALLIRMLPDHRGVAQPTHKMRWRIFDKNININYTYQEIWKTHSFVVDLLLNLFDNDENKFAQLLKETMQTSLSKIDRAKVLDWADNNYLKIKQKDHIAWEDLRKILSHHRSHPDTDWALPKVELDRLDSLYEKLKPNDIVHQNIWLFNEYWPSFPEGFIESENKYEKKHEQRQARIESARIVAVNKFFEKLGLKQTLELRYLVKEPWSFGDALAHVSMSNDELIIICETLNDDKTNLKFIHSFIFRKVIIEGLDWLMALASTLIERGFNNVALSNVFIPIIPSKQLWDFISTLDEEVQNEYWLNTYPRFFNLSIPEKIFGVQKLSEYKRFFSALDVCSLSAEEMPTDILSELLRKSLTEQASEPANLKAYEIDRIFDVLDTRDDLDHANRINLEWLYLPLLDSYNTNRTPKVLHKALAENPEFFVDILKWVYKSKNKNDQEENILDEVIHNRAKQAYQLLHSWKKIPGTGSDNSIDENKLREWIDAVRTLAETQGRLENADAHIGQVLAQYPEESVEWPQVIIFKVIEDISSDSLNRNYSTALFNKRGFSSRGPFDGGGIERGHAAYFGKLADDFKNMYPTVALIFKRLSDSYMNDAKRMDEEAEREKLEY